MKLKGNLRFTLCREGETYKIICAYDEVTWAPFQSATAAGERILEACKNAEKDDAI